MTTTRIVPESPTDEDFGQVSVSVGEEAAFARNRESLPLARL